ncbi:MAG: hypothetical protein ACOYN3_08755, partial [Acidimicrobiia bacterium]
MRRNGGNVRVLRKADEGADCEDAGRADAVPDGVAITGQATGVPHRPPIPGYFGQARVLLS